MSLPPIDRSLLPADVRQAPAPQREAHQAAMAFEQLLTAQLAETMLPEEGGHHGRLLPQALADGLTAAGGLGLARPLAESFAPSGRQEPRP